MSPVPRGNARPEGRRPEKHRATVDSNKLEEQCHPRKVFVGGLAHKTSTQHLRDHFGRFGAIVDAVVLRWPDGRSRGFGYVTFADSVAAASVLKENHSLSGREVEVKRAVPGTNKLFVGGLPQNTTANELRENFDKFGVVSDAVVMIDPATNRSRGFGFVCFLPGQEGAAAVTAALQQYDNHRIRGKWIEVKSAAPPHKLAAKTETISKDGQSSLPATCKLTSPNENECEEWKFQGTSPLAGPASSPLPSRENRERLDQQKSNVPALGSPRKVALPAGVDLPNLLQSPVGLAGPKPVEMPGHGIWGSAEPWAQPYDPWFGPVPLFAGPASMPPGMNPFGHHTMPNIGTDFTSSSHTEQSGSGLSESLQQNLAQFLRQSMQQKMEWGSSKGLPRDPSPSISTACSSSTHAEIAQEASLLP